MKRKTYSQNWSLYNLAQTKEKQLFLRLLSDAVDNIPIESLRKGNGRPVLELRDMLKCAAIKVFTDTSSRRVMSDIELAQAKGYIRKIPHFNSITNYLRKPELEQYIHHLYMLVAQQVARFETQLAIDSTGFSTTTYSAWYDWRRGQSRKIKDYKKLHIITGTHTNIVSAALVTRSAKGDAPYLPRLLRMTTKHFAPTEVSGDAAYTSRDNCTAVHEAGAQPFLIPQRNFSSRAKGSLAWRRMIRLWEENEDVFRQHYHRRSNVESTFSMIKRKFAPHIRSKKHRAQVNELLLKVVCHNLSVLIHSMFELNIDPQFT